MGNCCFHFSYILHDVEVCKLQRLPVLRVDAEDPADGEGGGEALSPAVVDAARREELGAGGGGGGGEIQRLERGGRPNRLFKALLSLQVPDRTYPSSGRYMLGIHQVYLT